MEQTTSLEKPKSLLVRVTIFAAVVLGLALLYVVRRDEPVLHLLVGYPRMAREAMLLVAAILCAPFLFGGLFRNSKPPRAVNVLSWCVVFAATQACWQIAVRCLKYSGKNTGVPVYLDAFASQPKAMWWIIPFCQVLAFALLGIYAMLAARLVRTTDYRRVLVFQFCLLMAMETILVLADDTVYTWSILLFSAGLAFAFSRWKWPQTWLEGPPRPMLVAAALVALVALPATYWLAYRPRPPQLPVAGKTPNVVLITLDTVRKQNLSVYGYERPTTPGLQNLAQRGLVFTNAIAPSSWTVPTHASLFTSLMPGVHHAGIEGRPLGTTGRTIAEVLQEAGYYTAGFIANDFCGSKHGLARGFAHYDEADTSALKWAGSLLVNSIRFILFSQPEEFTQRTASYINEQFLNWLPDHRDRPFFAFINYIDAHSPYLIPDPAFDVFTQASPELKARLAANWVDTWTTRGWWVDFKTEDPDEIQFLIDQYDGSIDYIDHQVSLLVDRLEQQGVLDDTLLIITNDHGEHFGEHGKWMHGNSLYRELIDAPLLLIFPNRIPAGETINTPVNLTQIPITVQSLLGLPPEPAFRGAALPLRLEDLASSSRPVSAEVYINGDGYSIRSGIAGGLQYIWYTNDQPEELYDLQSDPLATRNLVGDLEYAERLTVLRDAVRREFQIEDDERPATQPTSSTRINAHHDHSAPCCQDPRIVSGLLGRM